MSVKLYEENDIKAIADAIRTKTESIDAMTVSEMADEVSSIVGAVEETLLWENPNPTTQMEIFTAPLSDDMTNYRWLRIVWCDYDADPTVGIQEVWLDTASFFSETGTEYYIYLGDAQHTIKRGVKHTANASEVYFDRGRQAESAFTADNYTIPLYIYGENLKPI